jgi:plasmid stabilization system protein ParE
VKPVRFSPLASREVAGTAREYQAKAPGLGEKFISEVETATRQISAFPESAPAFGERLRRRILKRFPFALLYSVREDLVWIVAIMHQSRGPVFIAERLKDHL